MSTSLDQRFAQQSTTVFHPINTADKIAMTRLRAIVEPNKGRLRGIAARVPFDAIMEHVVVPEGVTFEAGTVGGVPGWWCKPKDARPDTVILHIHGGWFNWGSAKAFRNLVGHLAMHTGTFAFSPDYRLAPEHPFPAAPEDVRTCYVGLIELGYKKVAVTGDSAGGTLALGLLLSLKASQLNNQVVPVAGVALSPVTDLSLSGVSWTTRAAADPYFIRPQAAELVQSYLNGADPSDPAASPFRADLAGLPPIRVHVGDDEVLLDDSVRFIDRALAAGVDAQLDVWEGMVQGFFGSVGRLSASTQALQQIGSFLSERFTKATAERQPGSSVDFPNAISTPPAIEIRSLAPGDDASAFRTLNEEWITRHFTLEAKDRETLNDPVHSILLKGGHIFMAYAAAEAVGCVALIPMRNGIYELSKMAVSPHLRGRGIGRRLLQHAIAEARGLDAKSLFLGSNSRLKDAIHLYESVGFRHVKPESLPPMPYSRADVFMEMPLG